MRHCGPAGHDSVETEGVRRLAARGLSWKLVESFGGQALQVTVFVLIARLITPADFGLVALATVCVSFARVFVDQGIGDALVQKSQVTRPQINTALWLSLSAASCLALLMIVLATPIAQALGEPRVAPIIQALSITLILSALATVHVALLRRELAFRGLALRSLAGYLGGGITGALLAWLGHGAWALVGQQIAFGLVSVAVLWRFSVWRPRAELSRSYVRDVLPFGMAVLGSNVLMFLGRNAGALLVGATLGVVALGIYTVGSRILEAIQLMLSSISGSVGLPALSKLQHDNARMRSAFLEIVQSVAALIIPGYVVLALVAPSMTVLLFGARWVESGAIAAVLFVGGPVLALHSLTAILFASMGRPEIMFRYRLVHAALSLAGFAIALYAFQTVHAAAIAVVTIGYAVLPLLLHWVSRYAVIPVREFRVQLRGIGLSTLVMAAALILVRSAFADHLSPLGLLGAETFAASVTYWIALSRLDRSAFAALVRLARGMTPWLQVGRLRA